MFKIVRGGNHMAFSAKTRQENIEKLKSTQLDLLIIGGGITGAGITVEAGAKGLANGLIEMGDFASGTSSRSTKLIHGGLRYLKQFDVENVAEVSREREIIYNNAAHIVHPTPMILPIYDEQGASFSSFSAEVALKLYDELSDVQEEYKNYFLDKDATLEREPALKTEDLLQAGVYLDYTSDDARITTELMKKANEFGSIIANYVKAVDFIFDDQQKVAGVKAQDVVTGEQFDIKADIIMNATGPWSDETREKSEADSEQRMRPTKGVHLVVPQERLHVNGPIYTDSSFSDNRMIFIIPRNGKTYFGTTDTDYTGDINNPTVSQEDIDYLLKAVNYRFPEAKLTVTDIEASWAGLRPLIAESGGKNPSAVSRGSSLTESENGLITIAGGKLTDYRKMAEGSLKLISKRLKEKTGKEYPEVDTKVVKLSGGDVPLGSEFEVYVEEQAKKGIEVGLSKEEAEKLVRWFGSNVSEIFDRANSFTKPANLDLGDTLFLIYTLENEMALTPTDFFDRRTESILFDHHHVLDIKEAVVEFMADYYQWDASTKEKMVAELEETIAEADLSNL